MKTIAYFKVRSNDNKVVKMLFLLFFLYFFLVHDYYKRYKSQQKSEEKLTVHCSRIRDNVTLSGHENMVKHIIKKRTILDDHTNIISKFLDKRKIWKTSKLGAILFLDRKQNLKPRNRTFIVLIWKYFEWLKIRHVEYFGTNNSDPLLECGVRNCHFTGDSRLLAAADAVVVHLQAGDVPRCTNRPALQPWIFLTDESPEKTFMHANRQWSSLVNIFNWSMTYRPDADVPVPYGRVVPLPAINKKVLSKRFMITDLIPNWKSKRHDVLAVILTSNCVQQRMKYVRALKKYMTIDVYGKCSWNHKTSCPGQRYTSDCRPISKYLFYLSFENSFCKDYLSEKSFYQAYAKGSIPVVMGPSLGETERLLPPNSYLHVRNYTSPEELAKFIIELSNDTKRLLSYHEWRKHFEIVNEHGYFHTMSRHYCRVCEALNYNDESKKIYDYDKLKKFLDPVTLCSQL